MRVSLSYLCSLFLPLSTLAFLSSGPHGIGGALAWTLPVWLLVAADWYSPKIAARQPPQAPQAYFDALLLSLALLQLANILAMLQFVAQLPFTSGQWPAAIVNLIALRILVGTSSGSSGIIAAHELLHRPNRCSRLLGKLLLYSVCYDHFAIAHKRGHHFNVGKEQDIATARRSENFGGYWRRVCSGHFAYAWNSELRRLKIGSAPCADWRILQNRVLHGVAIELLLVAGSAWQFGWLAAAAFLYQAFAAVRLLEAINYFQHWGLAESGSARAIAWVSESSLTQYCLIGLSNHISHHRDAAKAFYRLPYCAEGPRLPYGYFVMNLWIKLDNASYRAMALRELERYEQHAALHSAA